MSPYLKSAGIIAVLLLLATVLTTVGAFQMIAVSGSGGLGSVSFGLSEFVAEYLAITLPVWAVIYWRRRRRRANGRR